MGKMSYSQTRDVSTHEISAKGVSLALEMCKWFKIIPLLGNVSQSGKIKMWQHNKMAQTSREKGYIGVIYFHDFRVMAGTW